MITAKGCSRRSPASAGRGSQRQPMPQRRRADPDSDQPALFALGAPAKAAEDESQSPAAPGCAAIERSISTGNAAQGWRLGDVSCWRRRLTRLRWADSSGNCRASSPILTSDSVIDNPRLAQYVIAKLHVQSLRLFGGNHIDCHPDYLLNLLRE